MRRAGTRHWALGTGGRVMVVLAVATLPFATPANAGDLPLCSSGVAALSHTPLVPSAQCLVPPPSQSRTHVLIVTGAAGEPTYAERFEEVGATLVDAFRRAGSATQVTWLAEAPQKDPSRIAGRSAKAEVMGALDRLASAGAGDQVLVVLVGHGSHEGAASRVNLPGPDITAAELGRKLDAIRGARVAVVNAASAGGDFVGALAKPGRIVATATKTAFERNETRFAEHFADALARDVADADKDGRVSLLEAFTYARAEVVRMYERDRRLLTEHAQLDDDGDGVATPEPTQQTKDGRLARAFVLAPTPGATVAGAAAAAGGGATGSTAAPAAPASNDPRVLALAREKAALEGQVADLRGRKATMAAAAYERELERLLVALAEKTRELRAAEGRKP